MGLCAEFISHGRFQFENKKMQELPFTEGVKGLHVIFWINVQISKRISFLICLVMDCYTPDSQVCLKVSCVNVLFLRVNLVSVIVQLELSGQLVLLGQCQIHLRSYLSRWMTHVTIDSLLIELLSMKSYLMLKYVSVSLSPQCERNDEIRYEDITTD